MHPVPHAQPLLAQPLVQLAVAFAAGILAAHFSPVRLIHLLICGALVTLFSAAALLKQRLLVTSAFITLAFIFTGAGLALIEKQNVSPNRLNVLIDRGEITVGQPVLLTGVLERPPESAPASMYLILRVEQCRNLNREETASGMISLMALINEKATAEQYEKLQLRYGTRIRVTTTLKRENNYRNPGVSLFTEYLERKGYDATGLIKSPLLVERLGDERVFPPLAWLYAWRQQVEAQINIHFSQETAAVLNASLLGNRNFLSRATAERFRDGGTFHVLVISGWHISVLGGLVFLISRRFTKKRVQQFLLSTTTVWCYALAVGAEASVVRAALMFTLLTYAQVIGRRGVSLNTLGAAALVLLIWRPSSLFDPSFQLTFLSVLAIVVLAWPLLKRMAEIGSWRPTRETPDPPSCATWLLNFSELLFWSEQKWKQEMALLNYSYRLIKNPLAVRLESLHLQRCLRYSFASVLVSLSVQVTLLPLFIIYFHRVSLSALILNVGVSLAMASLSLVAVLSLIVGQFSLALAGPLVGISNGLNWLMAHSVDPFMRLGVSSLRVPEYSGWAASVYVLYYVPFILLATRLARWRPLDRKFGNKGRGVGVIKTTVLVQVLAVLVIIFHPFSARRVNDRLEVNFLDVGQGDAALVTMPGGTTLLVDGGGSSNFMSRKRVPESQEETFERDIRSIGEAVVSEYLWWRGLDHVDYLLATHMDTDHVDGLNDVLRSFAVRSVLVGRTPNADPEFRKFYETAQAEGVPINLIGAGDVLRVGDASARVLWPMASRTFPSRNNDSIVLRLEFGNHKILLTGDIERAGEAGLLGMNKAKDYLSADVVKVPHHGSKNSSTAAFVKATDAQFTIISVGQTSIFGHPHREVVERWQSSGAEVLTTGASGMISVTTDGKALTVNSFVRSSGQATN